MPNETPNDPFFELLCQGYTSSEIAEIEQYLTEWSQASYVSVSYMELTMTNTTITNQNPELTKNHINQLLDQLIVDYQNTKSDRKAISAESSISEAEFTVLEEIELLTTDIRGYANQIKVIGYLENSQEKIQILQKMRVFDIPIIAQLYFNTPGKYENFKSYLRMLDYLRLLILEYLNLSQGVY